MTAALTHARRRAAPWNPALFDEPGFWPIASAARTLASERSFPSVSAIDAALAGRAGVRFTAQPVVSKRQRRLVPPEPYEEAIARGCVPTREGSWHDLMNALVWATFPRSKRALHAQQAREIARAKTDGLAGRRTRRHDALAVLDEGGVLLLGPSREIVAFGHALFEAVAIAGPRPLVRALALEAPRDAADLGSVDAALAALLDGPDAPRSPKCLVPIPPGTSSDPARPW